MKVLRCAGPGCSIVSKAVREQFHGDMCRGRCFCREALATMRGGADGQENREAVADGSPIHLDRGAMMEGNTE
jgi:hypothetical protein